MTFKIGISKGKPVLVLQSGAKKTFDTLDALVDNIADMMLGQASLCAA